MRPRIQEHHHRAGGSEPEVPEKIRKAIDAAAGSSAETGERWEDAVARLRRERDQLRGDLAERCSEIMVAALLECTAPGERRRERDRLAAALDAAVERAAVAGATIERQLDELRGRLAAAADERRGLEEELVALRKAIDAASLRPGEPWVDAVRRLRSEVERLTTERDQTRVLLAGILKPGAIRALIAAADSIATALASAIRDVLDLVESGDEQVAAVLASLAGEEVGK